MICRERHKLTELDIDMNNIGKLDYIKRTIQLAKDLQNDPENKNRLSESECLVCYYGQRGMHTNAFVYTNCQCCNKELQFVNSDTDKTCLECAINHKLCKHCGSDIQYKNRRKIRVFDFKERPKPNLHDTGGIQS